MNEATPATSSRGSMPVPETDAGRAVSTRVAPGGDELTPAELRERFGSWLATTSDRLPPTEEPGLSYGERLRAVCGLQQVLYDAGWAQIGWPDELGGTGGDALHRAVMYDELAVAGFSTRAALEHLEILAPAIARHWEPAAMAAFLPALLSGRELWAQGFSEPDAGSDLTSIRTRAIADGDGYRLTGAKIWTSWVGYAQRCVVLARTGSPEQRHKGLSVFFVDLDQPGIDARPIVQANGLDELGEVAFDDVWVPRDRLIGDEGAGWSIALDILSCERCAFAWLRQTRLLTCVDALAALASPADTDALGDVLIAAYALRASSERAVRSLAAGQFLGPEAAPVKVLLSETEQKVYDLALRILGPRLALGDPTVADIASWQEEYLFSRIVSVYGGTRQMQLTTIARFLLGLPAERPR
jgi:alkylation response protein AidB-like acyl-CoA dehydrogenase